MLEFLLLDGLIGDGTLIFGLMNTAGIFMILAIYIYSMWKACDYVESHIILFPVFIICLLIFTVLLPILKNKPGVIPRILCIVMAIANIGIGFAIIISLYHFLGGGLASYIYDHTLHHLAELMNKGNFIFRLLATLLEIFFAFFNLLLDLILFPFFLVPASQRFIWWIVGVKWSN